MIEIIFLNGTSRDDVAADQRHRAEPGSALAQVVAWGALAECLTSVFCPIVMVGALDVSATILNISGAFLAGIAHSADATPSAPRLHSACATFQAGFIGVFTSFTVLFEQAARLDTSPGCENRACGAGYVLAEMPPPTSQSQLCSSACGAISVSGGLAPALWGLWRAVLLNLSLHVGLALLAGVLLPQQPHFEGG
ncbi:hypothetical protein EMIHUDRAFT_217780 [Emiliania huxleyi CCMP1516]|uniref:Sodium/calcium exchanger membrane region domain-containing protein n=2 Tax=Emiliania huxleyi TaxID=2903 RepID=A0A0D3IAB1_EMIH1|nr:hypothetical protein EMIHUDRAFT_217780 [Emiliania huxleyi CCMP1516]EOD08196.1 hypothetical protein EMIHUDRAFT_217780 [Emiliania huxleyi CCMP1516]|eukprot:XP_005760625.1 hypothetical protein EMIHUDRAFT_217780 [Emiliania huxleyi CCMP1516]